ncbi:hypothetical protein FOL47_001532 [Perkinsus chesapeaki]|uniref:Tubulin--tyrosine ligase-like protein 9 n=1 Tax=Perkinsus chesapeaki TaxID=330153 RepID=A0A7J6MJW3_PERCH|nr:hypothetical protein FOL47_001532 [Perkinsus chesapeaki]
MVNSAPQVTDETDATSKVADIGESNNGGMVRQQLASLGYNVLTKKNKETGSCFWVWRELRRDALSAAQGHLHSARGERVVYVNKLDKMPEFGNKCGVAAAVRRGLKALGKEEECEWLPETYILPKESKSAVAAVKRSTNDTYWIIKPKSLNRGMGIKAYFARGYVRRTLAAYSNDMSDRPAHLTNQAVQKKLGTEYENRKHDSTWSLNQLCEYLSSISSHNTDPSWWMDHWYIDNFEPTVIEMAAIALEGVRSDLGRSVMMRISGTIIGGEIFGYDVLPSADLKPYLLEFNSNPAIFTNTRVLQEVIPPIIKQAIELIEFDNHQFASPLSNQPYPAPSELGPWQLIIDDEKKHTFVPSK